MVVLYFSKQICSKSYWKEQWNCSRHVCIHIYLCVFKHQYQRLSAVWANNYVYIFINGRTSSPWNVASPPAIICQTPANIQPPRPSPTVSLRIMHSSWRQNFLFIRIHSKISHSSSIFNDEKIRDEPAIAPTGENRISIEKRGKSFM